MTQLELTKQVFSRLWNHLRRRQEQFLAISAPAVFVALLLAYLLAQLSARSGGIRFATRANLYEFLGAAYLVRYMQWLVAFVAFGGLAAMAEGERSANASFQRIRGVFWRLVRLSLLVAPCFLIAALLSQLPLQLPRLLHKPLPGWLLNVWTLDLWYWMVLTAFAVFLFSVPALVEHRGGALDALADGVRTSWGSWVPRAALALVFVIVPTVVFRLIFMLLANKLHGSEREATVLSIYGIVATFFGLLFEFAALYGICLLYRQKRWEQESSTGHSTTQG